MDHCSNPVRDTFSEPVTWDRQRVSRLRTSVLDKPRVRLQNRLLRYAPLLLLPCVA